jgi:hypothetical protein
VAVEEQTGRHRRSELVDVSQDLELVGQVIVEVGAVPDLTLELAEAPRLGLRRNRHEPHARLAGPRDDDVLTVRGPLHKVGELRLGLHHVHLRRHGGDAPPVGRLVKMRS